MELKRLAFIGLGKMGKPMAANLIRAGYEVKVFNRSDRGMDELAQIGGVKVKSPAEAAFDSQVIHLCLPEGNDVKGILEGADGILAGAKEGTIIVDHSTIDPEDSKMFFRKCQEQGVGFLDAPISGGVVGAEQGTLSIMVGGQKEDLETVLPVLNVLGKRIDYLGPSGSGNVMKLVNNLLVGIHNIAASEAMVLATKAGLNPNQAYEIITSATGDSNILRRNLPKFVLSRNFAPAFSLNMLNKDLGLAEQLARQSGVRLALGGLARQLSLEGTYAGHGEEDMSVIIKILENLSGTEVK